MNSVSGNLWCVILLCNPLRHKSFKKNPHKSVPYDPAKKCSHLRLINLLCLWDLTSHKNIHESSTREITWSEVTPNVLFVTYIKLIFPYLCPTSSSNNIFIHLHLSFSYFSLRALSYFFSLISVVECRIKSQYNLWLTCMTCVANINIFVLKKLFFFSK